MKNKANQAKGGNASEVIIATQSFFLFAFGMAGIMATSAVVAGFNALRNLNSAVAIVTDEGIATEDGVVNLERVRGIIMNFELVGICVSAFGFIICVATCIRMYRKMQSVKAPQKKAKSKRTR
jgi:hypothetical protein